MSKKAKISGLFWTEKNLHWLSTAAFAMMGAVLSIEPPFNYALIVLSFTLLTLKLIIIKKLNLGNVFQTIKEWTSQVSVLSATYALNFQKSPHLFAIFIVLTVVTMITYIIMDFWATVVYNDSQEEK